MTTTRCSCTHRDQDTTAVVGASNLAKVIGRMLRQLAGGQKRRLRNVLGAQGITGITVGSACSGSEIGRVALSVLAQSLQVKVSTALVCELEVSKQQWFQKVIGLQLAMGLVP